MCTQAVLCAHGNKQGTSSTRCLLQRAIYEVAVQGLVARVTALIICPRASARTARYMTLFNK